jgi:Zn-dependent peptidase ImmA (M78 family)
VFAAALLLPEADVRRELVAPSWVPDRASARIAARFGVPRSLALVRLVKLGLLPGWQSDRW